MPRCFETFCESGLSGKALQIIVDQLHPDFECEAHQCSPSSPGPVENDETVAFLLINPLHYDDDRKVILPDAFQELTNRDLSMLRVHHADPNEAIKTKEDLINRGLERVPPKLRTIDQVCLSRASALRAADIHGRRILAVYDTALEGKPSHASVFTIEPVFHDKRLRKIVRHRVHEVMTKQVISFDEFIRMLN